MDSARILDPGQVVTQAVLAEVAAERERQVALGYSTISDDAYIDRELARASGAYALHGAGLLSGDLFWPWPGHAWQPSDPRRDLVRAAALAIAEIERLDRLAGATS